MLVLYFLGVWLLSFLIVFGIEELHEEWFEKNGLLIENADGDVFVLFLIFLPFIAAFMFSVCLLKLVCSPFFGFLRIMKKFD